MNASPTASSIAALRSISMAQHETRTNARMLSVAHINLAVNDRRLVADRALDESQFGAEKIVHQFGLTLGDLQRVEYVPAPFDRVARFAPSMLLIEASFSPFKNRFPAKLRAEAALETKVLSAFEADLR